MSPSRPLALAGRIARGSCLLAALAAAPVHGAPDDAKAAVGDRSAATTGRASVAEAARAPVTFEDATRAWNAEYYAHTFGAVVVDIDNDGDDDLVVGNHHSPPRLLLNEGKAFSDASASFPHFDWADRHGITAVDLDNDADRDLVVASGGADGIGAGSANELYQNLLSETGSLAFRALALGDDFERPSWRARHFLPIAGPDGSRVDLYLVGLQRTDPDRHPVTTNLYFSNRSESSIQLSSQASKGLDVPFNSQGKDLFFDFDRDGDQDLLMIHGGRVHLYRFRKGEYWSSKSQISQVRLASSVAVADVNNDGFLDVYVGVHPKSPSNDNVSFDADTLQFVMVRQTDQDAYDQVRFRTSSDAIDIDFSQHLQWKALTNNDSRDLYIGKQGLHPESRTVRVSKASARGAPETERGGTYLWVDDEGAWNILWRHRRRMPLLKGKLRGEGVELLDRIALESEPVSEVEDVLFLNRRGRRFVRSSAFKHRSWTHSLTAADLDNDGYVEIVGVRHNEQGEKNGEPFYIENEKGVEFAERPIMTNEEDDMYRADIVVHGFFDGDGLPDLFMTNGYGLNPGWKGPYKLFLNRTPTSSHWVLLRLEGTKSNRDAIGARIALKSSEGELLGYRELGANFNRGQDSRLVHFGLGSRQGPVEARIWWPGQRKPTTHKVEIDRVSVLRQ